MLRSVAAVVARVLLEGRKVQNGVAADQALQLRSTEQVDGWAAQQFLKAPCKGLKLHDSHMIAISHARACQVIPCHLGLCKMRG